MDDAGKSLNRMYINTFKDADKQGAIDQFLGNIEEEIDVEDQSLEEKWVKHQLKLREFKYTKKEPLRIYIGTWNVNDSLPQKGTNLDPWISPEYPNRRVLYK